MSWLTKLRDLLPLIARDVRNSNFVSVWFLKKNLDSVRNEFGSVRKTLFCSDIIAIYYLCYT